MFTVIHFLLQAPGKINNEVQAENLHCKRGVLPFSTRGKNLVQLPRAWLFKAPF